MLFAPELIPLGISQEYNWADVLGVTIHLILGSYIHIEKQCFGPHHIDADPEPTYPFDADPDPDFDLMRIRKRIRMWIRILAFK